MNDLEWRETLAAVNADVRGIIEAQRVLDDVNRTLEARREAPTEEDAIFRDAFGYETGDARVIQVDGVEIRVRSLHRKGLQQTDILGADLVYEIAGRKFILVQYKNINRQNRVENNSDQLDTLVEACPNPCPPPRQAFWPTCGSWYRVKGSSETLCIPACRAKAIFADAKSRSFDQFREGMSPEVFQQLFARCWIGARITPTELLYVGWSAFEANRVVFLVTQLGSFGRWPAS